MSARIVVNFRDGAKKEWPDPRSGVIKEYFARVKEGVLIINDRYDQTVSYPLDTIASYEETPMARF